jgi:hypothetical protein
MGTIDTPGELGLAAGGGVCAGCAGAGVFTLRAGCTGGISSSGDPAVTIGAAIGAD